MRLRTVMLVLALLFVPVMADAGNPREAEFSPPANEGVTIAAAAAGLAGWLYVANPGKRRRVEAVAGTMGHYFNHLPENRTSAAASAADGARVLQYVTVRYWVFLRCTARCSTSLGVTLNVFIMTQSRRPYHFATPLIYYAPSDKRAPSNGSHGVVWSRECAMNGPKMMSKFAVRRQHRRDDVLLAVNPIDHHGLAAEGHVAGLGGPSVIMTIHGGQDRHVVSHHREVCGRPRGEPRVDPVFISDLRLYYHL